MKVFRLREGGIGIDHNIAITRLQRPIDWAQYAVDAEDRIAAS